MLPHEQQKNWGSFDSKHVFFLKPPTVCCISNIQELVIHMFILFNGKYAWSTYILFYLLRMIIIQIVQGNSLSVNMIHAKIVSCSKGKVKHTGNRISFQWKQDCNGSRSKNDKHIHSLQLTFSPLKIDGWKTSFLSFWGLAYFQVRKC